MMDVGRLTCGQENKGNIKKSLKSMGHGTLNRTALRPLQPHIMTSTGRKESSPTTHLNECKKSSKTVKASSSVKTTDKDAVFTKKMCAEKGVQTENIPSLDYEMCSSETPPVEYWQVLAEQRRQALADTLEENEELHIENKKLRDKVTELERRLENKDYFAMMYQIVSKDGAEGP